MASTFDNNLHSEFDCVKDDDEEILWTGKPKFIPYTITGLAAGFGVVIFASISYAMIKYSTLPNSFVWFMAIPILFFLWSFLQKLFLYPNTSYAFTNKRVMIRTGSIGTNFKSIDYDKISDIEVTINIVERAFNVGNIKFFSGMIQADDGVTSKLYDRWEAIPNVYVIFKKVKLASQRQKNRL